MHALEANGQEPVPPLDIEDAASEGLKKARPIVCWGCKTAITDSSARIRVAGSHEQRFMNPHGYFFRFAVFKTAPGCRLHGPASDEYPWFPGFSWRYAVCGGCQLHLGWQFENRAGTSFFGLILDRIEEGDGD